MAPVSTSRKVSDEEGADRCRASARELRLRSGGQQERARGLGHADARGHHSERVLPQGTKESGVVRVLFSVGRDGRVLSAKVLESSGSSLLDEVGAPRRVRIRVFGTPEGSIR
jgi:hypothetical protein